MEFSCRTKVVEMSWAKVIETLYDWNLMESWSRFLMPSFLNILFRWVFIISFVRKELIRDEGKNPLCLKLLLHNNYRARVN